MNSRVLAVALLSVLLACDRSIVLLQHQEGTRSAGATACSFSTDPRQSARAYGFLDVGLRDTYVLQGLFRSAAGAGYFVRGVSVELHVGSATGPLINLGSAELSQYSVQTNIAVLPGADGVGVGAVDVIPSQVGQALRRRVCAQGAPPMGQTCNRMVVTSRPVPLVLLITPSGVTDTGVELSGIPFTYSLRVSCGTSVQFPPESRVVTDAGVGCVGTPPSSALSCELGQDEFTDCRLCASSNPLCVPLHCE